MPELHVIAAGSLLDFAIEKRNLNMFLETHARSSYGIRCSAQNYSVHEHVHAYPLYAIAPAVLHNKEIVLNTLL